MRMSLWSKFSIGFIVALPILLVASFLQFISIVNLGGAYHQVAQAAEAHGAVEATRGDLKDLALAARTAFSSGEPDAARQFQASLSALRGDLQILGGLSVNNPERAVRLRTLEALVGQQIDQFPKVKESRSENPTKDKEYVKASTEQHQALQQQVQALEDAIRPVVAAMEAEHLSLRRSRNAEALTDERKAIYSSSLVDILGLWLVAVAALVIHRAATEQKWSGPERRMHTQILTALPMGVCVTDQGGVVFYTNPAEDLLLGYPSGELLGRNVVEFLGQNPEESNQLASEIEKKLQSQGFSRAEVVLRKKNGTAIRSDTFALPMGLGEKVFRIFLQEEIK
jgi:PAS domain S-box-containing protein